MKDATFLTSNPTIILKEENVMDVMKELVEQPGREDPFYVLDIGDIVKKIKVWKLKLPRVEPFYAVKCNENTTVLETLATLGTGFDCASKGEMQKVLDLGVDPSRIIFAHPCKPISHIRQASKFNVSLMTFDNESELHKIKSVFPHAKLVIRIRCDAAVAQCELGMKFGVLPEDALPLLETAWKLGLDIVGVSFHVGSGCQEPAVFYRAISAARDIFDKAIKIGFTPNLLDIGGGYPGTTGSSLDELAHYINTSLDEFFPISSGVRVIAEPGRYVVASAFTLATCVVSRRDVRDDKGGQMSAMYYINDGVYGSFNCILFDHQEVTPKLMKKKQDGITYPSSVWGPTCDGLDQVVSRVNLPLLDVGDWIIWENMGAYTLSASTQFNGFPLPSIHVVMPMHTWLYMEEYLESSLLNNSPPENNVDKSIQDDEEHHLCAYDEDSVTVNNFLSSLAIVDG